MIKISGLDESGVGALAGPIVAVAVSFELPDAFSLEDIKDFWPVDIRDSKKYSNSTLPEAAARIDEFLTKNNGKVGVGILGVARITEIGCVSKATAEAHSVACLNLSSKVAGTKVLFVDGDRGVPGYSGKQVIEPKADENYFCVAMASVLSRFGRNLLMQEADRRFPKYGFTRNYGYFSKEHEAALSRFGPSVVHRNVRKVI